MAVLDEPAPDAELKPRPPIPARGLEETLRSWSGQGQLWAALGTAPPTDPVADRRWTATKIRRRANRVLFERIRDDLARWPADQRAWLEALPASTVAVDERTPTPGPGTSWARTRLTGWPPAVFVGRRRRRVPETLLSTVTRWTLDHLEPVVKEGAKRADENHRTAISRAASALELVNVSPLNDVTGAEPTPGDLKAISAEGTPWRSLVPVARHLLRVDDPQMLADLALEVVRPYEDLSGRLFHLGVLGEVLLGLRTAGAEVVSRHPLGDTSPGPAYEITDAQDNVWHLWFEAAGAWTYYGIEEPYPDAAAAVARAGAPLGTDLMLMRRTAGQERRGRGEAALLLECKHSDDHGVVARDGYLQAVAYAAEATDLADDVTSVVVGPEGVVRVPGGWTTTMGLEIGIVAPYDVPALIEKALGP